MTTLERQYRLLLRAYPRRYRARRGEEIIGTLLDAAAPGQRRPSRADVADLLGGGVRERLGLNALPGLANGLRLAGPIALTITAGLAAGSWVTGARHAAGTVIAAAWVAAVLARVALPRTGAAPAVIAWLATVATAVAVDGMVPLRGTKQEWFLAPVVLGAIAVVGTLHRPALLERASLAAGGAGLAALSLAGPALAIPQQREFRSVYVDVTLNLPQWALHFWLVPILLGVVGVALATGRRDTRALWAALILLVPTPLLVAPPYLPWTPAVPAVTGGRLASELMVLVLAIVLAFAINIAVHARQAETPSDAAADMLARCGRLCLAGAAGLAAFLLGAALIATEEPVAGPMIISLMLVAAAPLPSRWLPRWVTRLLLAAGFAAYAAGALGTLGHSSNPGELAAVAILAIAALLAWGRSPRGTAVLAAAAFAVTAVLAYGLAFTVADVGIVKLPFVSFDCPDIALCAAAPWSWTVVPMVTTAILVPTLVCAAIATLLGGGIRARVVFVVGLLWCLGAFVPMLPSPAYAVLAVLAYGLLQTARVAHLRGGLPANARPT